MRISDWSSDVCSSELDKLSVFGLVEGEEARLIKPLVRTLMAREALSTTEHGGLMFGPAGRAVMKGEVPVRLAEPPARRMKRTSRGEGAAANPVRWEETKSELQSLKRISYAVFRLNKKKHTHTQHESILK